MTVAETISEPMTNDVMSWKKKLLTAKMNIEIITLSESGLTMIIRLNMAVMIAILRTMKLSGISASRTPYDVAIAYNMRWISKRALLESAEKYGKSSYGQHLLSVAEGKILYTSNDISGIGGCVPVCRGRKGQTPCAAQQ